MDSQLKALAKKHHCLYTRYADDLTFSTSRAFPKAIHVQNESGTVSVGQELNQIIVANGFKINPNKLRLRTRHQRQEVTGLTVNRFPNVPRRFIRQIRAMLHAWEKYGYSRAEQEFRQKYDKRKGRQNKRPSFADVVKGKIEFVGSIRGKANPLYWRLLRKYAQLNPQFVLKEPDDFVEYDTKELKKAIWVLMDRTTSQQSTAFYLKNFGLITCDHAITDPDNLYIFQSQDPLRTEFKVTVRARDQRLDLATLDSNLRDFKALHFGDDSVLEQGDPIRLLGFPRHHDGADVSIYEGHLVHIYKFEKLRRFHISPTIIPGNSGGPVLDAQNRVIGVAIKGGSGELNAVVPISDLYRLP